jgi:uncharacterized Zn finger protein
MARSAWNGHRSFGNGYYSSQWAPYEPVAERRRKALKEVDALRKKGRVITPIAIDGRQIATTFWGKSWCTNLETYSDYENRLPRGRSYVRNGSVVHLEITEGKVEALVRGSSMYTVKVAIASLARARWSAVVDGCSGQIDSLVELLQGKISKGVMDVVTHKERGLFPHPKEIKLSCSCPDSATMCKHVAAVMYGVGARLDAEPGLLFRLRGVDPAALFTKATLGRVSAAPRARERVLAPDALGSVFGIDIDDGAPAVPRGKPASAKRAIPVKSTSAAPKRAAKANPQAHQPRVARSRPRRAQP